MSLLDPVGYVPTEKDYARVAEEARRWLDELCREEAEVVKTIDVSKSPLYDAIARGVKSPEEIRGTLAIRRGWGAQVKSVRETHIPPEMRLQTLAKESKKHGYRQGDEPDRTLRWTNALGRTYGWREDLGWWGLLRPQNLAKSPVTSNLPSDAQ